MTYTYKSTEALTPGTGHWLFTWTAPADNEGSITFYLAGLAADNDGTDAGDNCYTTSLKLNPITSANAEFNFAAFPNPVKDFVSVNYNLTDASNVKLEMIDLQGKVIEPLLEEKQPTGTYQLSMPLTKKYAPGVYFLRFKSDQNTRIQKLFITE